ncbi:MAG: alpha/beta hydrolase [Desulfobacterales bacterium]
MSAAACAAAIALALLGIYAFPLPRPSFRALYAAAPERVSLRLAAFRRRSLKRRILAGAAWEVAETGGGGEAVVFLHGLGASADAWFLQMEDLGGRFRCLAPTYPPLGSWEALAAGILELLDREGVARAHFVGSSMGGVLAQFLARCAPERVQSLVLGNTFPPDTPMATLARRGRRLLPWAPEWAILAGMRRNARRLLAPAAGAGAPLVEAYLVEQTCGAIRKAHVLARLSCLSRVFAPPDLAAPAVPCLVAESANDPLVDAPLREALRRAYPAAAVHVFPQGGHFPFLSEPDGYRRLLGEWLERSPPRTP